MSITYQGSWRRRSRWRQRRRLSTWNTSRRHRRKTRLRRKPLFYHADDDVIYRCDPDEQLHAILRANGKPRCFRKLQLVYIIVSLSLSLTNLKVNGTASCERNESNTRVLTGFSNAWFVTKRKKVVFAFLYHTKDHLA